MKLRRLGLTSIGTDLIVSPGNDHLNNKKYCSKIKTTTTVSNFITYYNLFCTITLLVIHFIHLWLQHTARMHIDYEIKDIKVYLLLGFFVLWFSLTVFTIFINTNSKWIICPRCIPVQQLNLPMTNTTAAFSNSHFFFITWWSYSKMASKCV